MAERVVQLLVSLDSLTVRLVKRVYSMYAVRTQQQYNESLRECISHLI